MKKFEKKGYVAVLYNPMFGWGIATEYGNVEYAEDLIFDAEIIKLVLQNKHEDAINLAESKYKGSISIGIKDAEVAWVKKGSSFRIIEYDGAEDVELLEDIKFFIA